MRVYIAGRRKTPKRANVRIGRNNRLLQIFVRTQYAAARIYDCHALPECFRIVSGQRIRPIQIRIFLVLRRVGRTVFVKNRRRRIRRINAAGRRIRHHQCCRSRNRCCRLSRHSCSRRNRNFHSAAAVRRNCHCNRSSNGRGRICGKSRCRPHRNFRRNSCFNFPRFGQHCRDRCRNSGSQSSRRCDCCRIRTRHADHCRSHCGHGRNIHRRCRQQNGGNLHRCNNRSAGLVAVSRSTVFRRRLRLLRLSRSGFPQVNAAVAAASGKQGARNNQNPRDYCPHQFPPKSDYTTTARF